MKRAAPTESLLTAVFGEESTGDNPAERARTSQQLFVRSQVQLTRWTPGAKGPQLTAQQALNTFGWDLLAEIAARGMAPLVRSGREPSETIPARRTSMGLSKEELAHRIGVAVEEIENAETAGQVLSIRKLNQIGQALALDESRLGFVPNANADLALGIRLRELVTAEDSRRFDNSTVLSVADAAWVIGRQTYLSKVLEKTTPLKFQKSANFNLPTYIQGYKLAVAAREILGLSEFEPIPSLRKLIEDHLCLPLIQQKLNERFAGATVANGSARGIVVNEAGKNSNVWVRRMTMCHEIGHLLWDPDNRLNRIRVDDYHEIEPNFPQADPVEIRANAFAIAFLAPPGAVREIAQQARNAQAAVELVMTQFGISATAATYHVKNTADVDTSRVNIFATPPPSSEWQAAENLSIDYFPLMEVPIARRGKFAYLTAIAQRENIISLDTAAEWLHVSPQRLNEAIPRLLELWE